jgi:hypothetical protein
MFGRSGWCLLAGLLLTSGLATGQQKISSPPLRGVVSPHLIVAPSPILPIREPIRRPPITVPVKFGFPQMAQAAGKIFAGTVTRVERRPATPGQTIETCRHLPDRTGERESQRSKRSDECERLRNCNPVCDGLQCAGEGERMCRAGKCALQRDVCQSGGDL